MKLNQRGDILEITSEVYQARNGGIFLNWGNTLIKLSKGDADIIADNIPNIDRDLYNEHYNSLNLKN